MRLPAAVRKPDRVYYMKHFVVKDIGDNAFRNIWPVELAIHDDLAKGWIKAAQLRSPCTAAPGKARCHQGCIEILTIQPIKQHL